MKNNSRGSIWRKWDLHVHTPASSGFHGTFQDVAGQIEECECNVIGISDYFTIDGYLELRKILGDTDKILFPVVEFRMQNTLTDRRASGVHTRLNFHLIFDPDIDDAVVTTFLNSLEVLDPSGNQRNLGTVPLEDRLQHTVDYFDVIRTLSGNADLKDHYLVWLPYDEYGGIDGIDPESSTFKAALINKADIIGTSRQKQIEFFHWKDERFTQVQYKTWFPNPKPCIKGSDSKSQDYPLGCLQDKESKPTERYCWIKADCTFAGLKQILVEPAERVFIGVSPPGLKRMNLNRTRYMDRVKISKIDGSHFQEKWFGVDLPLSIGLIAIIGCKGSGKSALSDTIALLGNSRSNAAFSFLNEQKFRHPRIGKAKHFEGELFWCSGGTSGRKTLDDVVEDGTVESVKYIPQNHLEEICNEVALAEGDRFDKELKAVIFSHVSEAKALGCDTLDDLIEYKTQETFRRIELLRSELADINKGIVALERHLQPTTRKNLTERLEEKKRELQSHQAVRPAEVKKPTSDASAEKEMASITKEIDRLGDQLVSTIFEIEDTEKKIRNHNKVNSMAINALRKVENLERQYERFVEEWNKEAGELEIGADRVAKLVIDKTKLETIRDDAHEAGRCLREKIDPANEKGLTYIKVSLDKQIATLKLKLDEPNKKYQAYLKGYAEWEAHGRKLEGDRQQSGSLKYIEGQVEYLTKIPALRSEALRKRKDKTAEIHRQIGALANEYEELYRPVQEFIKAHRLAQGRFNLEFNVSVMERGFENEFSAFISYARKGSFHGSDEGRKRVEQLLAKADFSSEEGVLEYLSEIESRLRKGHEPDNEYVDLSDMLLKNKELGDFYNFLYGLEYLSPKYTLRWSGKELKQLSPGERGTLLLVFYLLIDQSDVPLIIDQPEENLDNQTVYDILVPCIKEAKLRRQVIMVTHNPNLAVVCDADQVVHAQINKEDGNRVIYTAGAIENPDINKMIVDVLEGTRPAFETRGAKYQLPR